MTFLVEGRNILMGSRKSNGDRKRTAGRLSGGKNLKTNPASKPSKKTEAGCLYSE